ncbi:MAG: bifunctional diaminohydroxyphosphoribosylaminopyrimidine deaminase/5-amino-6-(5-phosphoribosylamino)uracil reductase RibD [Lachnospiraceae bacterium]|jgi:diaminohydroxyphosphoribosylaminopyrimidine deaminase/5-amino-6-(5-phosphoribosylamino)uracil reductase
METASHEYMRRAISLAKKGAGWTSPNPLVGAVIVKDGRIIGEGFHEKYREKHAERNALASLKESARGADMYVTLEPCCHYGNQPPCTEAVIENGIKRVFIGSRDPNPLVAGKGTKILRDHGITVVEDFLREECDALNEIFFHYITTKRPYVLMKYAMTIDGKIATKTGASKWITGNEAREHVHFLRGRYASVLAGIGTVIADDPMLNCRIPGAHQPLRIILDSGLRIPLESSIVMTAPEFPTLVVTAVDPEDPDRSEKIAGLREKNVRLAFLSDEKDGRVSIEKLLRYLGDEGIDSIFVEGGGKIHDSFRKAGAVDKVACYIAPKIFGGSGAMTPVAGEGIETVDEAMRLEDMKVSKIGGDILIEAKVKNEGEK